MNYIKEMNAFYDWLETNSIADSSIVLWFALMHICNKTGWLPEFAVAISTLETKTGMKKGAIIRARQRLQQVGRIDFKSRTGQQSAVYTIFPFLSDNLDNCVPLKNTNQYTNRTLTGTQTDTQTDTQTSTINKLNETKQKDLKDSDNARKKKPKKDLPTKTAYAEFVTLTDDEHAKLIEQFGKGDAAGWVERLNLYKGSTGKKYASDYMTILSWSKKDGKESKQAVPLQRGSPNKTEKDWGEFAEYEAYSRSQGIKRKTEVQ